MYVFWVSTCSHAIDGVLVGSERMPDLAEVNPPLFCSRTCIVPTGNYDLKLIVPAGRII